ncbi:HEPN domain-containing protein [Tardiphaga sp. 42S5]|uniref:HEPN domain-containing protein n=1 Tax=Tardiphaga sp. 42S5 TaxID=1404799 RepID=UPI002A59B0BF|nr:HEPN domain-containing protein [Tardiphaga sp. 42S5]WPO44118.1 HEPN domain-containing protein [Tardiphaga sp. 42S5]
MEILDKPHFEELMEEIDRGLKSDNVPIHARQIIGWTRVCQKLELNLPMVGQPIAGVYSGPSLSGHIKDWYDARYGDRLKIDFSIGYIPIAILEDLYLVRLPLVFGAAQIFIDRSPRPTNDQLNKTSRNAARSNIADWIVDLTDHTRTCLSEPSLEEIFRTCITAFEQANYWHSREKKLVEVFTGDLKLSATQAIEGNFGLSRWHSLQAAEKATKAFIRKFGENPPFTHDLNKLTKQAARLGSITFTQKDVSDANCPAGVRYEGDASTQAQALSANEAARRICFVVTSHWDDGLAQEG